MNGSKEFCLNNYLNESDLLSAIFDVIINNEKWIFVGNNYRNENVVGTLDLQLKTLSLKKLNSLSPISGATILNSSLQTLLKTTIKV